MVVLILHTGREDGARRSQETAGSAAHLLARLPPPAPHPGLASLSKQTASKAFPQAWPPGETSVGQSLQHYISRLQPPREAQAIGTGEMSERRCGGRRQGLALTQGSRGRGCAGPDDVVDDLRPEAPGLRVPGGVCNFPAGRLDGQPLQTPALRTAGRVSPGGTSQGWATGTGRIACCREGGLLL